MERYEEFKKQLSIAKQATWELRKGIFEVYAETKDDGDYEMFRLAQMAYEILRTISYIEKNQTPWNN